jgi:hypothetical protein
MVRSLLLSSALAGRIASSLRQMGPKSAIGQGSAQGGVP